MSKKRFLDRIEIPKPCFADWERMVGTEQIRFCEECNKQVYNLSRMTRGEAEALVASAPKGRLCARLTRDAAGVTVTSDDQPGVHLIWRRASPIANAVVSAMLTMATPGVGCAAQISGQPSSIAAVIDRPDARTDSQGAAALSGNVVSESGAPIRGAVLTLINEDTGDIQTASTSNEGAFRFFLLTGGLFTLKAGSPGYYQVAANGLNLGNGAGRRVTITLEGMRTNGGIGGAIAIPSVPLRELYSESDCVVAGRVTRSFRIKGDEGSNLIRTTLNVTSTLKGEGGEGVVNVYHFDYGDSDGLFSEGESLLAFLKHAGTIGDLKSTGSYEPGDYSRGIKKLSSAALDAYAQRINELAQLAPRETPGKEELVEWLVRCAEVPGTRWEGAFELASSAASLRASCSEDDSDEETDSTEQDEEKESEQSVKASAIARPGPGTRELDDKATFAVLLTVDQKERLINALLSAETLSEGDLKLIEVVKDFHDPRLLPFLVSLLRRTEDDPPEFATGTMRVVAELLQDNRIDALAKSYDDIEYDREEEDENAAEEAAARKRGAVLLKFLQQVDRVMRSRNLTPAKQGVGL